jgi:hypothetical protein
MGEAFGSKTAEFLKAADEALKMGLDIRTGYFNRDNKVCLVGALELQGRLSFSAAEKWGIMAGFDGVSKDNPALDYLRGDVTFEENFYAARQAREILIEENKLIV